MDESTLQIQLRNFAFDFCFSDISDNTRIRYGGTSFSCFRFRANVACFYIQLQPQQGDQLIALNISKLAADPTAAVPTPAAPIMVVAAAYTCCSLYAVASTS